MLSLPMVIVGLTGGLGAGKTTIAGFFQDCGAAIIDADQLAREVVKPGKPAWREIRKQFGTSVFFSDQTLDRQALAQVVFQSSPKLAHLQKIIHPRVARQQAMMVKAICMSNPQSVIIYDAALLIEADAYHRMDHVIVVKADRITQISRVCRRDGLTKTEALRRIKNQMPLRQKLLYADTILDGTLPRHQLRLAVKSLYRNYHNEARQRRRRSSRS